MSTSPNLPPGAFITTLGGRRCTAIPRTDISSQTSTTSTFSTSLLPTNTAAPQAPPAPPVPVPIPIEQTTPVPIAVTTSASIGQSSIIASLPTPEPALSAAVAVPPSQASVADSSIAALSTTPLTPVSVLAATPSSPPPAAQVVPVPAQSEVTGSGTVAPFATLGQGSPTAVAPSQGTTATVVGVAGNASNASGGNGSTMAVAGAIIGGVALVSIVAFFIWFWRRRQAKKQRDTLLTPLSADPSFGRGVRNEEPAYSINRDSIGPTPRPTKFKAAFRAQYARVGGRFGFLAGNTGARSDASISTAPSVDMNQGNSNFIETLPIIGRGRKHSSVRSVREDRDMSFKERVMQMWSRVFGSGKQDLAGDDEKNDIFAARGITGSMRERERARSRRLTNKPDFLTLLNMDDSELDRETRRLGLSRTRGGSLGSSLGGLHLDFGADPFGDANAVTFTQPRARPPVAPGANNPFSDANATDWVRPKPSTYIDGIRHSRGQSMGSSIIDLNRAYDFGGLRVVNEESRPPSSTRGVPQHDETLFRESQVSAVSFESFAMKRDKFRSDPFDLEQLSSQVSIPNYPARPGFKGVGNYPTDASRFSNRQSTSMQYQQSVGDLDSGFVARPAAAYTSLLSNVTSQYSSGLSQGTLDEWSDPGPDIGPATTRQNASRRSSAADAYSPYSSGRSSRASSRRSKSGSVMLGYAL